MSRNAEQASLVNGECLNGSVTTELFLFSGPGKSSMSPSSSSPEATPTKRPTLANKRTRCSSAHPLSHGFIQRSATVNPFAAHGLSHHSEGAVRPLSIVTSPTRSNQQQQQQQQHRGPPRSPLQYRQHLSPLPPSPPSVQLLPLSNRTCKSCKRVAHSTLALANFKRCHACQAVTCNICTRICNAPRCAKSVCSDCAVE